MGFQEGVKNAKPILLEPVMKIQVIAPASFLGDITGDVSSKRGVIREMSDRFSTKVIDAEVPLSEMFGYATTLRSITQGRGNFTMEFDHYAEVPNSVAQQIIEGRKK